jgi:flagellar biosynthetic protein FlhB
MADDMGDKTEAPTPKKLSDARNKGQVPKSVDLSSAVDLIGAVVLVYVFGQFLTAGMSEIMRRNLGEASIGAMWDRRDWFDALSWSLTRAGYVALPFLAIMFVVAYLAQVQQVKFLWTFEPLQAKLERLNPVAGLGRIFSKRSAVKTLLSAVKLVVVGAVVVWVVRRRMVEMAGLPMLGALEAFGVMAQIVMEVIFWMLLVMLAIGVLDWFYQKWQLTEDLKMTKNEVKDEFKSMEGNQEVKGRRLKIAKEIAMQRARQDVPKADVVVTNPTHFAVALKYDPEKMAAPVVVAKGEDWMAFRIRELAAAHGVPVVERPPLARALYASVKVGQMVKPELFEAVAEVLAFVYRIGKKRAG